MESFTDFERKDNELNSHDDVVKKLQKDNTLYVEDITKENPSSLTIIPI